jgi:hypothetical protein
LNSVVDREAWVSSNPLVSEWLGPLRPYTRRALKVVFYDIERLVGQAAFLAKKSGKRKCEIYVRALSRSYKVKGGLGYWTIVIWT